MRVIAGSLKGRQLKSPDWPGLRPTSDRLRETIFNVLASRVEAARVLDAYAGTGAMGIEAISRGARHVVFLDRDQRAYALIKENLARCGVQRGYAIIRATAARGAERLREDPAFAPFDVILLDPPYDQPPADVLRIVESLLAADGILVLEHARRQTAPADEGRLLRTRELKSGDSMLSLYACRP
jgi:16S rRNA (guanine(966)-N(2))-methyltransferase RsmD